MRPGGTYPQAFDDVKLMLAAEHRWRRVNAPHLVALVRAGVKFPNGQAAMFPLVPADDSIFARTPSVYAAEEIFIHNI